MEKIQRGLEKLPDAQVILRVQPISPKRSGSPAGLGAAVPAGDEEDDSIRELL